LLLGSVYVKFKPTFYLTVAKEQNTDISALVTQAQKGDTQAFGQVYDAMVKPIYRYIYYRVDPQIAEDLTEETFLKAWQNLQKYKKGETPFSSWIFKIAHNLVCDYYRKNETHMEVDENMADPQDHMSPERTLTVKIDQIRLRKAINKLPEKFQQVILLKYINDLDNTTIAKTVGKTEGAVRIIQFRALKQLKTILTEKPKDF